MVIVEFPETLSLRKLRRKKNPVPLSLYFYLSRCVEISTEKKKKKKRSSSPPPQNK